MDLRNGLPIEDNSADFIYNEHFIEHLKFEGGEKAIKEFYRVLKKGGILRIATPDLDYLVEKYLNDWKNQDWLTWPEFEYINTKGLMINISMRDWGHEYLYNEEDLRNLVKKAGFKIEVLVINNNCTDNTSKIAKEKADKEVEKAAKTEKKKKTIEDSLKKAEKKEKDKKVKKRK